MRKVPLILLPGMDGTAAMFRPLLAALPEWIDAVPVEYPVHGRCDYESALPHVDAAVQQHANCHVLGWSFSGPLALRIARLRPERVRSVTLVATFVLPPRPKLLAMAPLVVPPAVAVARLLRKFARSSDRAAVLERVPARAFAARLRAIRSVDARDDLVNATQPLQYIASSRDRMVPRRCLDTILGLRSETEVQTIDGDHFALHGNPASGAKHIAAFVERHSD